MTQPDTATIRRIAVAASCDPRSVQRELATPGAVRGLAGHRIRSVLAELGLATPPEAHPLETALGRLGPIAGGSSGGPRF